HGRIRNPAHHIRLDGCFGLCSKCCNHAGIRPSYRLCTLHRDSLPRDVKVALERTMATAGRTVTFSGLTVSTSLLGLMFFPEMFLRSMSMGAIAATLVAMLAALTILPALLAVLGHRINALSIQRLFWRKSSSQRQVSSNETQGAWYRIAEMVMRRPVVVGLAVLAILVTLG